MSETKIPLISCIITCYNAEKFIGEAIESVINQTYKNIEIIIVDDYSTDKSREIINSFSDKRIIKIFHKKNYKLPAIARNSGIKVAKGEYIAFLDGDDVWMPNKLESSYHYLKNNNGSIIFTDIKLIDAKGSLSHQNFYLNRLHKINRISFFLLLNNPYSLSSVLIHNNLLIKNKFNEDPALKAGEDYYLWLMLNRNNKIYYINEKLVYYRKHENNISKSYKKRLKLNLYIIKLLWKEGYYNKSTLFLSVIFSYLKYYIKIIK